MKDLRQKEKTGPSNYLRFLFFLERISKKRNLIIISVSLISAFILFFPSLAGKLASNWYYNLIEGFKNAN